MPTLKDARIAIIGGSIAGCAIAALLQRFCQNVTVFERSTRPLEGRGAGVFLPEALVQQCINMDLFDAEISRLKAVSRAFFVKDPSKSDEQHKIWTQSFIGFALNWSDIYKNLRKRVTNSAYLSGETIVEVLANDDTCQIKTESDTWHEVDFLIAADGINSIIRKKIMPASVPHYADYIAWRGVIDDAALVNQPLFANSVPYYVHQKGHLLFYCIPSLDFQTTGKKLLNWVMYENCENTLDELLVDNKGLSRNISLPPGSLTPKHIEHLHHFAHETLPSQVAEIICQTEKPFMQAVFDLQVAQYVEKHVCLIGDAATVLRPHSASGTVKAILDSIQLAETFKKIESDSLKSSLDEWNSTQLKLAKVQSTLAKNMGEALVMNPPNWHEMDDSKMEEWWRSVVSGKQWYATDL